MFDAPCAPCEFQSLKLWMNGSMKNANSTQTGSLRSLGTTSLPEPSEMGITLLTAHGGPLNDFFEVSRPKNLLFFSSSRENSTEKSICTACYVSALANGQQLELFGVDGLISTDVPKWKRLDPKRKLPTTAANT